MFLGIGNATVDESMLVDAWLTPGETMVVGAPRRDLGGKGADQALVLGRTGATVRFIAAVGHDAESAWIADRLRREGLGDHLLAVGAATDRSLIFVDRNGENGIASTVDAVRSISPRQVEDLVRAFARAMRCRCKGT